MKIQFEGISVQNTVQCWHFREKRYLYISLSALSSNKSFLSLFKINVWYLLSTFQAPTWPKSQETNHNTLDWKRGIRSESSAVGQTYQAEDHLVEHRPQTPPVDCPVVRLFAKNLWCQVLRGTEEKAESQLAMFVKLIRRYLFLPLWWAPLYIYIFFFYTYSHSLLESRRKLRLFLLAPHLLCTDQSLSAPHAPEESQARTCF